MQELKAKLLEKRTITLASQAKKFITFDIYDLFFLNYQKITELAYWKLQELPQTFSVEENPYLQGSLLAQVIFECKLPTLSVWIS